MFYLKERFNPQFDKPYYVKMGKVSKREIARREKNSGYGSNNFLPFITEEEYNNKINELIANGFNVK